MKLRNYRYESVAVLDGAIIMTLELVGARLIAPYFGSTIFVWTAVIGVILGALSLGYWYGGRLADRGASDANLTRIMSVGAAVLLVSLIVAPLSLELAASAPGGLRMQAFLAALMLFAPFNVLAGIVSPYLAKLKLTSLEEAGSSVGQLYAAGTAGSILGTFVTGYWLIGLLGSRMLGFGLVVVLLASTVILSRRTWWWQRLVAALAAGAIMSWPHFLAAVPAGEAGSKLVYDGDSMYSRYLVRDAEYEGRPIRRLFTDRFGTQSAVYLDDPADPPLAYIQRFMDVAAASVSPQRVLIIGGGTYTLPQLLTDKYPDMAVDVVEIDPHLDVLARSYFGYKPSSRIRPIHADGRTFLNDNKNKYDIIYIDAYSSLTPPFTLTTTEAVGRMKQALTDKGIIAVNLISAIDGDKSGFMRAELATFRAELPAVAVGRAASAAADPGVRQNLILLAGHNDDALKPISSTIKPLELNAASGRVLTDDFAPIEHLLHAGY